MSERIFLENVKDIVFKPGEMRERERTIVLPEHLGEGVAVVPAGSRVELNMRLESVHEGILATIEGQTEYEAECVRCLTPFKEGLQVDFTELFAYTVTEADEYGVHGDHVDLEPPLRDAVVLALPFGPVCKSDCAGLDPETGELRTKTESDEVTRSIDSRWAKLAELTAENTSDKSEK